MEQIILETNRLILRTISLKDKDDVFKYRSDSQTNKYQGWIPKKLEEVEQFISKNPKVFNQTNSWYQLVIIEKTHDIIIGDIGIHFLDDNFQIELGCTLDKEYHSKGYATEALKKVINVLFTDLTKHRITTSIDPGNYSSIKLVEGLGFRKEAHFKESIFMNGVWVDDIVYALLKSEWNGN